MLTRLDIRYTDTCIVYTLGSGPHIQRMVPIGLQPLLQVHGKS